MSLIFGNLESIRRNGLKTNVKGSGKGGRDAVHFMYHNDNGQGYIRMAEGTTPPRSYKRPVYLVLDPSFIVDQQLFLTKNGVVLFHGDMSFQYLHVKEQPPTLACNVIHKGCGHSLPPSVTGGSGHSNTTWQHVRKRERHRVLFLDLQLFLMKSEPQHGSSWVNKFHKTMEDWFLALHWTRNVLLIHRWIKFLV